MNWARNAAVEPVGERYELVGAILGASPEELRRADARRRDSQRWVYIGDGQATATAVVWRRPDGRVFLNFAGDEDGLVPLVDTAADSIGRLHVLVSSSDERRVARFRRLGFEVELETETFLCRFDDALRPFNRVSLPSGYRFLDVRRADSARLFDLDNIIRQDVPGSEGWQGDWEAFLAELDDPAAYVVAESAGGYVGLARIWRNPEGPKFGLVGVTRPHRGGMVGPALIKEALAQARRWGYQSFATFTSTSNRAVHPRLVKIAHESLGRDYQMVRG